MTRRAWPTVLLAVAAIVSFSLLAGAGGRPITVDDLMKLRSVNDVRISPAGDRVAYVASVPSLPKNEHEAGLLSCLQTAARRSGSAKRSAFSTRRHPASERHVLSLGGRRVHDRVFQAAVGEPRGICGHVLREPAQQREQMRRNHDWFKRWIPPADVR